MYSKAQILDALKEIIDPEIGLNIVDVGLVYRVEPTEESIEIDFTLTAPGCPLGDFIVAEINRVLRDNLGFKEVIANLVWNPPWSIDFMSEDARLELGYPI